MPFQLRECLWCAAPLAGRSDKKFCTNSCKAHYARTARPPKNIGRPQVLERASTGLSATLIALPLEGHLWDQGDSEEADQYWKSRLSHARTEYSAQDPLHTGYALVIEGFLFDEERPSTLNKVNRQIQEALDAIGHYLQHPGLRQQDHIAHRRLFDLYLVHHYLCNLREGIIEPREERLAGAIRTNGHQPSERDCTLYIPDRERHHMWLNILFKK